MQDVFDFLKSPAFESDLYANYLPGSYQKLDPKDPKYQSIASFFQIHNQRLSDYLQQFIDWL